MTEFKETASILRNKTAICTLVSQLQKALKITPSDKKKRERGEQAKEDKRAEG